MKRIEQSGLGKTTRTGRLQGQAWPMTVMMLFILSLLVAVSAVAQAAPQAQDAEVPSEEQRALFTKGQTFYTHGIYSEAISTFNEFLKSYPNSSIKDLTLLWLGRSYLRQGDVGNAERIDSRLREVPTTPYLDIYEDELRIARHNYARSVVPSVDRHRPEPVIQSTSQPVPTDRMTASVAVTPSARNAVITNPPLVREQSQPVPVVKAPVVFPNQRTESRTANAAPIAEPARAAAPLVRLILEDVPGIPSANGTRFYRVILRNEGNSAASNLVVREELGAAIDFGSSDPAPTRQEIVGQSLFLTYRLAGAIQPGEARAIRIAVRPRSQVTRGSATGIKHSITYTDLKGKTYNTQ